MIRTGYLPFDTLAGFLGGAELVAYPSLGEGFGLPVLEAMARGVPLACSNATSLPEVAGDAAVLFDPHDTDAMAAAIGSLLADRRRAEALVARGRERAEAFTWERCAGGVFDVYQQVLQAR